MGFIPGTTALLISVLLGWIKVMAVVLANDADNEAAFKSVLPAECLEFTPSNSIWRYRYCHMDYVEQFSSPTIVASVSQKTVRHSLGKYSPAVSSSHQSQNIVGEALAFSYIGGDACGKGGHPRMAVARLSCSASCRAKNGVAHISSVSEPSLCVYMIDICSPNMCVSGSARKLLDGQTTLLSSSNKGAPKFKMDDAERKNVLDRIKGIFYHAYEAYLRHAFPLDELKPLSCKGTNTDLTPGGMLTLIDALDTLATLGNVTEFQRVVRILSNAEQNFFHVDTKVSVFETTIRILGGLLSAHVICVDPKLDFHFPEYDGALLRMAQDLGDRLLPAFQTVTSVPYGTVHLTDGVPYGETTEACTAAAGSLSLEFGMLSVLTGDPKYGAAARSALKKIYELRSGMNLIGRHLDINTGHWTEPVAGIGSNIDSVYEYFLKQYILFGDDESYDWFQILYEGAMRHLRLPEAGGRFYQEIDMKSGHVVRRHFSALQAFWPGMQILGGDVYAATKSLNGFLSVWEYTSLLPEDFDLVRWNTVRGGSHPSYLLRPELAESVFYAYRATKDESWLAAGKDIIDSVSAICYVPKCGFAAIQDVDTKQQMDAMPSFFLSEWVKYLYLLFDEHNFLNEGNWVFTTEAHPFRVTNWTQNNTFVTSRSPLTPLQRRKHFSRQDYMPDVPSLENDEDVCRDFSDGSPESYYRLNGNPQVALALRPFDKEVIGDLNAAEKRVSGILPDVGTFEIVSTASSFSILHVESNNRLVISNLDSTTGMVWTNDHQPTAYLSLDQRDHKSFMFGQTCLAEIYVKDVCEAFSLVPRPPYDDIQGMARVYRGPCSVADGFGNPSWMHFVSPGPVPIRAISGAPHLCNSEISDLKEKLTEKLEKFYIHAWRGDCSFQEKAQNAHALGASGLLVTLRGAKDEPFIMAHTWNGDKESFRMSASSFLTKKQAGNLLESSLKRPGAEPLVVVQLIPDTRIASDMGKVTVKAFPQWEAVFGPQDDQGIFKLGLQKKKK